MSSRLHVAWVGVVGRGKADRPAVVEASPFQQRVPFRAWGQRQWVWRLLLP